MVMEMVEMDNVVRCYRGIDPLDDDDSLFAVKNGSVMPSSYIGEYDPWLTSEGFGSFDDRDVMGDEYNESICALLDTFELLWEKQE